MIEQITAFVEERSDSAEVYVLEDGDQAELAHYRQQGFDRASAAEQPS